MNNNGIGKYRSIKDYPRFGKIAVDLGFITEEQLKIALNEQVVINLSHKPHSNLGEIFLNKGWITLRQIIEVLEKSRKEYNVSAFTNAIRRDIKTLTSIILLILTAILLINLRFLSVILDFIPPISIGVLLLIILGLVFICIYISKLVVKNAINELEAYDRQLTNYLTSLEQEVIERKRLEEERLLQSKQDWKSTFDTINDMITVHDKDFNIISANKKAEEILKLPDLEINKTIKCFKQYHRTDHPPEGCPSCKCVETGEPENFELFEPHLNKYIEIRAIPRFDPDKQLIGLIHIVRDITERKKAESNLKLAAQEWRNTFDSITDFISVIDNNFKYIKVNKSTANFLGVKPEDLIGKYYYKEFHNLDKPLKGCPHEETMKSKKPVTKEIYDRNSGLHLLIAVSPILDEKGELKGAVHFAKDITKRKKMEKEIKNKIEDLEKFYDMAVGREVKMKELKKENNKLKSKLSQLGKPW